MSSKIVKNVKPKNLFKMREFATVERGEKDYDLRSFADDEELSVQDMFSDTGEEEPETIFDDVDEITDRDYLPPSRLAKAEDGIVGEKVELPEGKLGQGFVEAPMFSDSLQDSESGGIIRSSNNDNPADLEFEQSEISAENESASSEASGDDTDTSNIENISEPIEEDNSVSINEEELNQLREEIESLKAQVETEKANAEEMAALKLTVEKALMERDKQLEAKIQELEDLKNSIPEQIEAAKEETKSNAFEEAKQEFAKDYEVQKEDYASKLDGFINTANQKLEEIKATISSFDEEIPQAVIGFLKTIIGEERKINDKIVLNVIKENLSRLSEYRDIEFVVNPEDVEVVTNGMPDYKVTGDISVPKGAVVVNSKSGEITLNIDTMIKDLEQQINAQIGSIKND